MSSETARDETRMNAAARARASLAAIGAGNPGLEADLLMAEALRVPRVSLYRDPDRPLGAGERTRFEGMLARRLARTPLQYVLGRTEFYGLELATPEGVFIPRPETETLVDAALAALSDGAHFADIGAGTGAIGLSVLSRLPRARGIASDVSALAVQTARANAAALGAGGRLRVEQGDLLSPFEPLDEPFDAVLSNPPYIPDVEIASLPPEVREHEPHAALAGGPDGLDIVRRIASAAPRWLRSGGFLALEIGYHQGKAAAEVLAAEPLLHAIDLIPDLAGRPRIVRARRV